MKKIFLTLALLFFAFLPNAKAAMLTDNLIGYWKFDNNALDSSGGSRDLDLYGDPGFSGGIFGQALSLNGNGTQYAQRPVNDTIYNFGAGDFTIQVWVNLNTLSKEQILIEKFEGQSGPGWTLTYYPGWPTSESKKIHFYTTYPAVRIYSEDVAISAGEWQHVIMRRSSSSFDLFFNDFIIGSFTYTDSLLDTVFPLLIGRRNYADGRGFYLDGKLDEVAIWNRAMTVDEIALLYNQGSGYEIPTDSAPVPEPATMLLLASGLVGLVGVRKRLRKR